MQSMFRLDLLQSPKAKTLLTKAAAQLAERRTKRIQRRHLLIGKENRRHEFRVPLIEEASSSGSETSSEELDESEEPETRSSEEGEEGEEEIANEGRALGLRADKAAASEMWSARVLRRQAMLRRMGGPSSEVGRKGRSGAVLTSTLEAEEASRALDAVVDKSSAESGVDHLIAKDVATQAGSGVPVEGQDQEEVRLFEKMKETGASRDPRQRASAGRMQSTREVQTVNPTHEAEAAKAAAKEERLIRLEERRQRREADAESLSAVKGAVAKCSSPRRLEAEQEEIRDRKRLAAVRAQMESDYVRLEALGVKARERRGVAKKSDVQKPGVAAEETKTSVAKERAGDDGMAKEGSRDKEGDKEKKKEGESAVQTDTNVNVTDRSVRTGDERKQEEERVHEFDVSSLDRVLSKDPSQVKKMIEIVDMASADTKEENSGRLNESKLKYWEGGDPSPVNEAESVEARFVWATPPSKWTQGPDEASRHALESLREKAEQKEKEEKLFDVHVRMESGLKEAKLKQEEFARLESVFLEMCAKPSPPLEEAPQRATTSTVGTQKAAETSSTTHSDHACTAPSPTIASAAPDVVGCPPDVASKEELPKHETSLSALGPTQQQPLLVQSRTVNISGRKADTDKTFLEQLPLYTQCVWEVHEDAWANFATSVDGKITYDTVVWPDWRGETDGLLKRVFSDLIVSGTDSQEIRRSLRVLRRRWHTDKFCGRFEVAETEMSRVKSRLNAIIQLINEFANPGQNADCF